TAWYYGTSGIALGTYYWKVVVHDSFGHTTTGDVWSFTRVPAPHVLLYGPEPLKGQYGVPTSATLTWQVESTYPFPLLYDVYFGQFGDPNLVPVATNLMTPSYTRPGGYQAGTQYNWYIVAHGNGLIAYGPPWSFYTGPLDNNTPSNPSPPYLGFSLLTPTLTWSVTNPTGEPLTYQVHMGTMAGEFPLPLVAIVNQPSYQPGTLEAGRRYYWKIDACTSSLCTQGPEWTFVAQGAIPVLISKFDASPGQNGVQLR